MAQLHLCFFLAFLILACSGAAHIQDAVGLRTGVWDVSTLVPGSGAVPPYHELHVEAGQWVLRERNSSRVGRFLDSAGALLGITYAAVPSGEATLCHSTPLQKWESTALRTEDGVTFDCSAEGWFTTAVMRKFAQDGFVHLRFEVPQPLSLKVNGTCVETTWNVHDVAFARVSDTSVIVSGTLRDNSKDAPSSCKTYFELTQRPTLAAKETSSSTSAYAPVMLLLVVIAMRLLPRYILTRTGQIDRSSYRGKNPGNLSAERREELLRKQRRILEKMKAEDRANAPKEKAS